MKNAVRALGQRERTPGGPSEHSDNGNGHSGGLSEHSDSENGHSGGLSEHSDSENGHSGRLSEASDNENEINNLTFGSYRMKLNRKISIAC